jgi:hypothetical protein
MDTRRLLRKEIETRTRCSHRRNPSVCEGIERKESACLKPRVAGCFTVGPCQGLAKGRRGYSVEKPVKSDVVVIPFPFSDLTGAKKRPALVIADLPVMMS